MKFAVCDDEKLFRQSLINALYGAYGRLDLVCIPFSDGKELMTAVRQNQRFDAIFLDIEMEGLDGMETAVQLRKKGIETPIVFLTSHTELAMEGYEVSAFRFLSKPVKQDKLEKMLGDLKRELQENNRILIRENGEDVIVSTKDILYVEAQNNEVNIVLSKNIHTVRKKISDMEQELGQKDERFVRIHRGYLVNLAHVKNQRQSEIELENKTILPLGRKYAANFKERLFDYVKRSSR